jgi:hypothetical protein
MSYIIDQLTSSITVVPESNIDDIIIANSTILTFYFPDGKYYLDDILNITKSNIKFIGLSKNAKFVHIFQNNTQRDGLNVIADNFFMQHISVHVPHDGKIALTVAAANNTSIQHCYFYGNKTTFSVFYAGPKSLVAGPDTINGYNNNTLDMNNTFRNNVIYSQWSGDCVSFSLQMNGLVNSNIIRGGKLAVYMCKKCDITNNVIYDSIDSGIHISLPSEYLNILSNKIYECDASGIKISDQTEHGSFTQDKYNIMIKNNYIYDAKTNAIELNDVNYCIIRNNKLISTETNAIYILRSKNIKIDKNKVAYFIVAFWLENSSNCNIYSNKCMSVYPNQGHNVVKLAFNSNNNKIYNNDISGTVIYDKYVIPSNTVGNMEYDNSYYEYYDISEEINIVK